MNIRLLQKKIIIMPLLLSILLILQSCHSHSNMDDELMQLPSHKTESDPAKWKQEQKLQINGVKVIQTGQYTMVSIPAGLIFAQHSPKISWGSYPVLNDVACYIRMFRKVEVEVNVYEYCHDTHNRIFALSLARASEVADYLVDQGIDGRIVISRGLGNDKPIMAKECSNASSLGNSRIEIAFKEELT
jgi:intracellular multiplication protein IcmN